MGTYRRNPDLSLTGFTSTKETERSPRNPFLAAVRQSLPEMGRPGALRQPVGHAHPSAGQPDPRDAAQILPGGCRVRRRQGRQRLRSPGPRRGGQKVGSFFRQPPAGKEKNARCSKFFEQLQIHPCPNFHEFPWRGHEQKAFHRPFLIGGAGNNQPGPGNRAVYTTTAQDD